MPRLSRTETNAAVDHLFGYTGRDWDADADLQYNRARWYDPAVGRWLSEDPIGFEAGDPNLSRYVENNPTMNSDPSGLQASGLNYQITRYIVHLIRHLPDGTVVNVDDSTRDIVITINVRNLSNVRTTQGLITIDVPRVEIQNTRIPGISSIMQNVMLRTQILTHGIRTAQLRTVSQVQVMFVAENVTRNGVLVTPRIEVPMGQPIMLTVNGQAPGDNPLDGQDITNRDGQLAIEQAANQRISIPMHLYDRHLEEAQRNAARNAQNGGNPP